MRIDVWSDVVCPWCYLGHRRLAAALAELGDPPVEVHWHAFQLDPRAPAQPQELRPALERKYGPGAFDAMSARLTSLGAEAGIDYRFDLAQRVNTQDAHRLVAWAGGTGAREQGLLVERLFRAYFTEGADVSDRGTLAALAAEVGLDREGAVEVLGSDGCAGSVLADQEAARELGITGVPAFVVDERFLIPGAQDVATFVRLLGRALERTEA